MSGNKSDERADTTHGSIGGEYSDSLLFSMVVAELQPSHHFDPLFAEASIFKVLTAANAQVSGGRQLDLRSFLASEAAYNGGRFINDGARAHPGWGLYEGPGPGRKVAASRDLRAFPPSLHSLAWKIGAWPVKLIGAQSDMSLG